MIRPHDMIRTQSALRPDSRAEARMEAQAKSPGPHHFSVGERDLNSGPLRPEPLHARVRGQTHDQAAGGNGPFVKSHRTWAAP